MTRPGFLSEDDVGRMTHSDAGVVRRLQARGWLPCVLSVRGVAVALSVRPWLRRMGSMVSLVEVEGMGFLLNPMAFPVRVAGMRFGRLADVLLSHRAPRTVVQPVLSVRVDEVARVRHHVTHRDRSGVVESWSQGGLFVDA